MNLRHLINRLLFKKRWEADFSGFATGHYETFYTRKGAIKSIINQWHSDRFITLKDSYEPENNQRIKKDPDGKPQSQEVNCKHTWDFCVGEIFCKKCGATIRLACNHGGSVGCSTCTYEFAKRLNAEKDRGASRLKRWRGDTYGIAFCKLCGFRLLDGKCPNSMCLTKLKEEIRK